MPRDFPPLRSLDNPELPNNLPSLLSEFVGRADELVTVRELARSSRLVTLCGTGGCGKTRLALQVAADLLDGTGEGVWFVDLATISDADQVPRAVVSALGLQALPDRTLVDSIVEILRDQFILLVLDNCEHVIDACAKLADAIGRGCRNVHLLATSLEPLGIDGECFPCSVALVADGTPRRSRRPVRLRRGTALREAGRPARFDLCTRRLVGGTRRKAVSAPRRHPARPRARGRQAFHDVARRPGRSARSAVPSAHRR